ncbi:BPTI/Kunitz-type proteinase inhibitor domain-containing protein [Larkinella rosea]|uniref:BPTI/Kunitz-type proteinase inhibitor domain-containing protein n=1 Tax=Larkinella rosea TaxID=2025312 RepID=UPI001E4B1BDE|nr:BPTI/Kunitz-type proteinase inhibitor domain-containing protein [Larkinella rosea]
MKPITAFVIIAFSLGGCEKNSIKSPRCELKPESGPCFAAFTKYYYDPSRKVCKSFVWGGCGELCHSKLSPSVRHVCAIIKLNHS